MQRNRSNTRALKQVRAHRISTDDPAKSPVVDTCEVAVEGPVTIDVADVGAYTVLCTPDHKRAMAVGFLFSEGIIDSLNDIAALTECMDDPEVMRVRLLGEPSKASGRNLLITSSCGLCGSESMEERLDAMPKVGDELRIKSDILRSVRAGARENQVLFKSSGGTHAAQIFGPDGELITFAEDIGRHNALDKAIGMCLLSGRSAAGCGAALSGRVSLEMVGKCARAGIEVISAVSAPTSLALDAAERCRITLCAFVRDDRATVFTCPWRVVDQTLDAL